MKTKWMLVPLAMMFFSTTTYAQKNVTDDIGWFVGGHFTQADTEISASDFSQDVSDNGIGAFGGYNFNEFFGLEGGFEVVSGLGDNRPGQEDASLVSFSITPKFTVAVNQYVGLFMKAGFGVMVFSEEYNGYDEAWAGVVPTFGAGINFNIVAGLRARIAYDYASGTLDYNNDDHLYRPDVDAKLKMFSVGAYYQF